MNKDDVLAEIQRIVVEEWSANSRPLLLSKLPSRLEEIFDQGYKAALGDKPLKAFIQDNETAAGIRLVQDPVHQARVGVIPGGQEYVFPRSVAPTPSITLADARAFGRVLDAMTAEEQRLLALPAGLVARLLAAR